MESNLKKQIWIMVGILIIAFSFYSFFFSPKIGAGHQVIVGSTVINVEVMRTAEERGLGLSGHEPLAANEGMLFIFDKPGYHGFWMKDMLFPIDIVWLAPSEVEGIARIVHIETNLSPDTYPKSFVPFEPAQYVLEVNAGTAMENVWTPGVKVEF